MTCVPTSMSHGAQIRAVPYDASAGMIFALPPARGEVSSVMLGNLLPYMVGFDLYRISVDTLQILVLVHKCVTVRLQ